MIAHCTAFMRLVYKCSRVVACLSELAGSSALGAVSMSATPAIKAPKPPPLGVERTTKATVRYAFGLPVLNPGVPGVARAIQNVDKFLTNPFAEQLPDGFSVNEKKFASIPTAGSLSVLSLSLMTKKKKPMAAGYISEGSYFVIVMRGDRSKQSEHKLFDLDQNTIDVLTSVVFTTNPKEPCNYHPWFSSILLSLASGQSAKGTVENPFGTSMITAVNNKVASCVSNAIKCGRVVLAVCVPSPQFVESALHKLAIDKTGPSATASVVAEHVSGWIAMADKAGIKASHIHQKLKEVSSGVQEFAKIVSDLKPVVAGQWQFHGDPPPMQKHDIPGAVVSAAVPVAQRGKADTHDDEPEGIGKGDPKHPEKQESVKHGKAKRHDHQKREVQPKFIAEAAKGSRKADEREEREAHTFQKKLNKTKDTDDENDDDGDSEMDTKSKPGKTVQKQKKKNISDSDSDKESELDDSGGDDSDEEDSSDGDDESDDDSDSEASATSSEDEGDGGKPTKIHRRLVKASDLYESSEAKLTQTTLNMNGAVSSSSSTGDESKRKQLIRPPPAKGNRAGVAAHCNLTLDGVEACAGIPLSLMPQVSSLVAELRDGFSDYESDKFPIKKTYALHTASFNLITALRQSADAGLTSEQKNDDASASRRLAVSTTSALLKIAPSLDRLEAQNRECMKAIGELQKVVAAIVDDFKASAASIDCK